MKTRTAALTAVLVAAGLALAGCGGGSDDPTATKSTSVLPLGSQLNSPQPPIGTATPGGGNVTNLPAGFPLPPGTTVGRVATRPSGIAAPMNVPDGDQAAAFWKQALPAAGYTISKAEVTGALGEIKFSGHGCLDGSQIGISGSHVAFECDHK
jgi:hypothetical protein